MAFILFTEPQSDGKRCRTISHDQGVKLQWARQHPDKLTPEAREKLSHIQAIWLGRGDAAPISPPDIPMRLETAENAPDRLHEGIAQGAYQGLPVNDR